MTTGQILYSSYGYEQTNINFYEVIGVSKSGKSVDLQPIGNKIICDNGFCCDSVIPDLERKTGEPLTSRRILTNTGASSEVVNVSKYKNYTLYAYKWDGNPLIQTSYY